ARGREVGHRRLRQGGAARGPHPVRGEGAGLEEAREAHGGSRRRGAAVGGRHRGRLCSRVAARQDGGRGGEPQAREAHGRGEQRHGAGGVARRQGGPLHVRRRRPARDEDQVTAPLRRAAASALASVLAVAGLGCPSPGRQLAYDLARRLPFADRWSSRDVILFGTPAAEPHEAEGFYREAGEGFVWARDEAELSLTWPEPAARAAVLELAPFRGVKGQSVKVGLNGVPVGEFKLNDLRYRYRLSLPAAAQHAGENRLRFTFTGAAAPSDLDSRDPDRRRLAAAFYSLTVGTEGDAGLDDLLGRDAPAPFEVVEESDIPSIVQVGPSVIR